MAHFTSIMIQMDCNLQNYIGFYNVLISELIKLQVNYHDIMWIVDFLTDRTQCVKGINLCSATRCINNGTPQGTRLAPLLFIVMVNAVLVKFREKYSNITSKKKCPVNMDAYVDDMI